MDNRSYWRERYKRYSLKKDGRLAFDGRGRRLLTAGDLGCTWFREKLFVKYTYESDVREMVAGDLGM